MPSTSLARRLVMVLVDAASRAARLRNSVADIATGPVAMSAKNSSDELPCQDSAQETAALACCRFEARSCVKLSVPAGQEAAFEEALQSSTPAE